MSLLFIAFIAGILTVLAPCILPLLPVVVGGSLDNTHGGVSLRRAFVVIASLSLSIILFTLLLKVSTLFIAIPQEVWQYISGTIIIGFGLISVFPSLWERLPFVARWSQGSNVILGKGYQKKNVWGDIIIGASLGPVFSTCSPTYFVILATILPVSFALGLIYLGAYTLGLALSLLGIAFVGQKVMAKLGVAADPHGAFKRSLGVLFLLVGIAIVSGYDKKIEAGILSSGAFDVTTVEQKLLQENEHNTPSAPLSGVNAVHPSSDTDQATSSDTATPSTQVQSTTTNVRANTKAPSVHYLSATEKAVLFKPTAEITGVDGYINTGGKPIKISDYRGKAVVLLDFWTYSCINCQRTLPYVTSWYGKYKDKGLVIIGIHTPEFAFEHVQSNVEAAMVNDGITYPVVLDNEYATWNAFGNQYWPRKYLIDIDGYIVYDHAGEGNYDETEMAIQKALMERNDRLGLDSNGIAVPTTKVNAGSIQAASPETYFGAARNEYLGNGDQGRTGEQSFTLPVATDANMLYLGGKWDLLGEYAETTDSNETVEYAYDAKGVYFVAGAKQGSVTMEVSIDGKPIDSAMRGVDVFERDGKTYVIIAENRLYRVIDAKTAEKHLLEFIIGSPGLQAYTFTFG